MLNILTSNVAMTEEQIMKNREKAKTYYQLHKNDPDYKARVAANRKAYKERNIEHLRAKAREHYEKNKDRISAYHRKYYAEHRDKMRQRSRDWKANNPERYQQYMEKRKKKRQREKEKKVLPSADKIATIFKNPAMAAHYKWLMQKRGYKQESEVEHEVTE